MSDRIGQYEQLAASLGDEGKRLGLELGGLIQVCDFERDATSIATASGAVPQLLQTEAYMMLLHSRAEDPDTVQDELAIQTLLERQRLLWAGGAALEATFDPKALVRLGNDSIPEEIKRDQAQVLLNILLERKNTRLCFGTDKPVLGHTPFRDATELTLYKNEVGNSFAGSTIRQGDLNPRALPRGVLHAAGITTRGLREAAEVCGPPLVALLLEEVVGGRW